MKTIIFAVFVSIAFLFINTNGQTSLSYKREIEILKAEDERRYDKTLEDLMKSTDERVRIRAALATGRIGDDAAIPALTSLLEKEKSERARAVAAFALGEIESIKAADVILSVLKGGDAVNKEAETRPVGSVPNAIARLVEAAGKIAAANPNDPKSKELGRAILQTLETEEKRDKQNREVVLLALTAALRARPDGADIIVADFLTNPDARVRADAANTLARLRAKTANAALRKIVVADPDPVARANAARVLGAAEDKEAVDVLIKAATSDSDSRVRVSAVRALASVKDTKAAHPLIVQFRRLLVDYSSVKRSINKPKEKNEILEIENALGRLLPSMEDKDAVLLIETFRKYDAYDSPESEIAFARIAPASYGKSLTNLMSSQKSDSRTVSAVSQGLGELSALASIGDYSATRKLALEQLNAGLFGFLEGQSPNVTPMAAPELMRALARFKPDDFEANLRTALTNSDVFVRATAAELLAEHFPSQGARIALENAFKKALTTDKHDNDAQLAMLDAMAKINKAAALDTIYTALDATDYLVRKKAFELLNDPQVATKYPGVISVVENARAQRKDQVFRYNPKAGTKLGQVLNKDADYRRAAMRKNGTAKAILTTEKGTFTINLLPEDAPLTVDNFIKLARANYFNGLEVHRVVPNFVMQDGDPRGDGNGGPGWSIRCEINMVPYERGAVGMALSGKDTGGSQWFVTHSPQPHLDGGYTVFGRVNETGMKVVDNIVRGDKILTVRIVEGNSPQRRGGTEKRTNRK